MGNTIRRARAGDDPEDVLEFTPGQAEARLSKQLKNDRQRAIVNRSRELKRAKGALQKTQDLPLREQLRQKINRLEAENKQEQRFL